MFKKLIIVVAVIAVAAFVVSGFLNTGKGGEFSLVSKEVKASSMNKAIVVAKVKNTGAEDADRVLVKAKLLDEGGKALEEPFELAGPIKAGETISVEIKSYADYYKVKSADVVIESTN